MNKVSLHEGLMNILAYAYFAYYVYNAYYVFYVNYAYYVYNVRLYYTDQNPVAELDGDQTLDVYWIDPVEAMDSISEIARMAGQC